MLALFIMVSVTVADIFMLRQAALNWQAEHTGVPGTSITVHPYHLWVMTFFYMSAQFVVGLAYWFTTKDVKGMVVLIGCAAIFSLFAVQDLLFFQYQGQTLPDKWTWLYWQNAVFGPLSGTQVFLMASSGLVLIFALFYLRLWRLGRRKR